MPEALFWIAAGLVVHVYVAYPLMLAVAVRTRAQTSVQDPENWPTVTLIISAYNEARVIAAKLENALQTAYPGDLEIIVVSDASDDGTDDIVRSFADRGVILLRMEVRGGKTVGLNEAVQRARGEVIVFSDANAMYRPDAIRMLVRRLSDPGVGAVVGESTYEDGNSQSGHSEGLYWRYETWIKALESRMGSVVGGDGAIYAIRRCLYEPMRADALSDFVNPLQVVRAGYRCAYEPRAVSVEEPAEDFEREYRRKVRIVNRAWRATIHMKEMMNPFKFGWFSFQLISHKVLRWWVGPLLIVAFSANILLIAEPIYQIALAGQLVFYGLAFAGRAGRNRSMPAALYIPYYFCLVNAASIKGLIDAFRGETYTTWATPRASTQ